MVNLIKRIPNWMLALALSLLALAVRLLYLTETDIAGDEPFSIFMAQFDVLFIIQYLSSGNNPPLFEILLHYYMLCFGDSDFTLRLFPAICSSLTVIPIFFIGERFFNRSVAVAASLLFIFSIFHIRFSHEVRVYPLFSLTVAWTLFFFLLVIKNPDKLAPRVGLVICNVVLLYAHFTSFYILFIEGLCLWLFSPRSYRRNTLEILFMTGVFYVPYLMILMNRINDVNVNGIWVPEPGWRESYGMINLMLNGKTTTLVIIGSLLFGILGLRKREVRDTIKNLIDNKTGIILLLWFILPYTLMFIVSKSYIPMFIDRYVLYTSIPLFLAISWLVDGAWRNAKSRWFGIISIILISITTTSFNPPNNREIKATVEHIKEINDEATQVYLCPDNFKLAFAYHYNKEWFGQLGTVGYTTSGLDSTMNLNKIFAIRKSSEIDSAANRIIYLDADSRFTFPENGILEQLKSHMLLVDSTHFFQIFNVYVFEKPTSIQSPSVEENVANME